MAACASGSRPRGDDRSPPRPPPPRCRGPPDRARCDPLQLSMVGVNPVTAYLLLNRYVSLMPGDWIGQTAANSAMGQYIIKLAKLAGVKTLNVVRREEAAEQVRQFGGDRVVLTSYSAILLETRSSRFSR